MFLESILILLFVGHLHKRIRFYFVTRKNKKIYSVIKGAEPVFCKGSKVGMLLLHGFTSTPQEIENITNHLIKKGYTVHAPLLKGHGTDVRDLARTRKNDWEKSAIDAYERLAKVTDKIYIIGSSMGGNLALRIEKIRKVEGIVLIGTPVFFSKRIRRHLIFYTIWFFKNFKKKTWHDENAKKIIKNKIHYLEFPMNCLMDMVRLINLTEKELNKTKAPTLILQSETDTVLPKENAELMHKIIGSKIKKLVWIPDSYHVIPMDKNIGIALKEIDEFINRKNKQ